MRILPVDGRSIAAATVANQAANEFASSLAKPASANAASPPHDPPPPNRNAPAPVATGNVDYYRQRLADFERRNPGMTPPDYYMGYGDKYAHRFADLGPLQLSSAGLAWRDRTLMALQNAIEAKRIEDPAGFAQLECDPEAFKAFAYATHTDAYIDSGLFDLSAQDLAVIAMTPDIQDVLSQDGLRGWKETISELRPADVADIAKATIVDGKEGVARVVYSEAKKIWDGMRFTF